MLLLITFSTGKCGRKCRKDICLRSLTTAASVSGARSDTISGTFPRTKAFRQTQRGKRLESIRSPPRSIFRSASDLFTRRGKISRAPAGNPSVRQSY